MKSPTNPWWKHGIIYQIYPRSFADTNNDGIGDLNGITNRLDYLADLGVDALWLSPINPSPDVDFGYDVSDYLGIDPKFGTMRDFERLIKEAKIRHIHIILDLVLNHTSDQHPWFLEAKKSKSNTFHDYYLWKEPQKEGTVPNNWQSIFGGLAWEYIPELKQFFYHMFYKQQPDVNWRNPKVRKALLDVFRFWLRKGVDGFRLDVFNVYFKDSKFRDNPVSRLGIRQFERQVHSHDYDQPEMFPLLKAIRKILDTKPGSYCVGETFMSTPSKAASYCKPGLLHATFDFGLLESPWNARRMAKAIRDQAQSLDVRSWPTLVLSNHDTRRIATRHHAAKDDRKLKLLAILLLTLRGTPYLYYGDEIGMRNVPICFNEMKDKIGKKYWFIPVGRDGCRSPMQWDASSYAGFSKHTPWIKVHANHIQRNVETLEKDEKSILNFHKNLIRLRRNHPALQEGKQELLPSLPRSAIGYIRQAGDESFLVALNFSVFPVRLTLPTKFARERWQKQLSSSIRSMTEMQGNTLLLRGHEAIILEKKGNR
jgi:alpha-glucosidase